MNPVTEPGLVNEVPVDQRSVPHNGAPVHQAVVEPDDPKPSLIRRLVNRLIMVAVLVCGVIFAMYKARVDVPVMNTPKIYAFLDSMGEHAEQLKTRVVGKAEAKKGAEGEEHAEEHKVTVTTPLAKDVIITQEYVCQIRSRQHIDVCAIDSGYIKTVPVKEGQEVKEGQPMFEVMQVLYKAELAAEVAERDLAQLELTYTQTLADKQGVSQKEVSLFKAKLAHAQAKMDLAQAKLTFATVKAPFDGIIDRLKVFPGSLVKEGDVLTTLSDNAVMWVYFNVTEKRYLEYMAEKGQDKFTLDVKLVLANHTDFRHVGKIDRTQNIGAIEANFNNETGNIAFRADFPNPERLLRHGQTGTVKIDRTVKGAIVVPQRATFENLAKRYVFVLDKDHVVHQREIVIEHELDDIFVISAGIIKVDDIIILEGIRQVRDGEKVEYKEENKVQPEVWYKDQKNVAE